MPITLFGTALGPLVSEISFNLGLPIYQGVLCGILAGFISGFFMPVLAQRFFHFHKGFCLYNTGFTAGIIATLCTAIFRSFGFEVDTVHLISQGNNKPLSLFLFLIFAAMLIVGLIFNRWSFRGCGALMKESGRGVSDFIKSHSHGPVFINMSLLGIIFTIYILLVGGELNGPVIGGIFTIVGFGVSGKHLKNVLPILAGVYLVSHFSVHDVSSTAALLAALFGTSLSPISGHYGLAAGVIAGGIHAMLTANISFLHAGMNLYNNGFSGGFVAAITIPIFEKLREMKNEKKTTATPKEGLTK